MDSDPVALLTIAAIGLLPIQISAAGLSFRFAVSDVLIAVAVFPVMLNMVNSRASFPRDVMARPLFLGLAVSYAAVVGSVLNVLQLSALVDRLFGAAVLGAYLMCAYFAGASSIRLGMRLASVVAIGAHVAVSLGLLGVVSQRNAGALEDPNNAGLLLAVLLVFTAGDRQHVANSWRARTANALVAAALMYFLIETGSRSAWISFAIGFTVFAALRVRNVVVTGRIRPAKFLVSVMGVITVAVLAQGHIEQLVSDRLNEISTRPDNVTRRVEVYEASFDSFVSRPFTGGGLFHTLTDGIGFPHSSLFWLAGDAGVLGLLAFCYIALSPLARSARGTWSQPEVAAALVVMIVGSFMIEALYQRIWWVLIAAALVPLSHHYPNLARTTRGFT